MAELNQHWELYVSAEAYCPLVQSAAKEDWKIGRLDRPLPKCSAFPTLSTHPPFYPSAVTPGGLIADSGMLAHVSRHLPTPFRETASEDTDRGLQPAPERQDYREQ
jgi:hypothetical protein